MRTLAQFYEAEDEAYDGDWQIIITPAEACDLLEKLSIATGEDMPNVTFESEGEHHMALASDIWLLRDDLRPINLCHEWAHVIQTRADSGPARHDNHFATLVCLMAEIVS